MNQKNMNFAMRLSFLIGILLLFIKGYAYFITSSTAIFSDAAESVIHIFAVGFSAYSMWLSFKPADENHLYGHDKIAFFASGFEGAMIIIASFFITYEAVYKMINGFEITQLDNGMIFIMLATLINALLSFYLIKKGKKYKSIILEANGKHILTDCYTSLGVILALILVKFTHIIYFDPLIALLVAANILYTGSKLLKKSISGLMDEADPILHKKIMDYIEKETRERNLSFHNLKHRVSGHKVLIELHLLFNEDLKLKEAHEIACELEASIKKMLAMPVEIFTHLEPKKNHDQTHEKYGLKI